MKIIFIINQFSIAKNIKRNFLRKILIFFQFFCPYLAIFSPSLMSIFRNFFHIFLISAYKLLLKVLSFSSQGFVRFGRWLCRPLELHRALARDDRRALPRFVNAVRFHFFLHRDSLVCASLCVQRQPALLRLGRAHLEEPTRAQPVILGLVFPFLIIYILKKNFFFENSDPYFGDTIPFS